MGYHFIDLDSLIAERESMSIPEIFDIKGEIYFRKKETEYLREQLQKDQEIIMALGGGTPCYGHNLDLIKESGIPTVYLRASVTTLFQRLQKEKQYRPMISHLNTDQDLMEFIGKHLFERQNYYNKADHIIDVNQKTASEVVSDLQQLLF